MASGSHDPMELLLRAGGLAGSEGARNLLWWGGHKGVMAWALLLWRSQVALVQRGSFQWEELL